MERRGDYESAEKSYKKAHELDNNHHMALHRLGFLYSERFFNFRRAISYSRRLAELAADYMALEAYSCDLIANNKLSEGADVARRAQRVAKTPFERIVARTLVTVAELLTDKPKADQQLGRLVDDLRRFENIPSKDFSFAGLSYAIMRKRVGAETKFILLTLLDVVSGKVPRDRLSFFSPPRPPSKT